MNIKYYIYFQQKNDAEKLKSLLNTKGYQADVSFLDYDGGQWSLVVSSKVKSYDEMDNQEDELQELAEEHGGEYDGNEVEVPGQ